PEAKDAAVSIAAWSALAEGDIDSARTSVAHQPDGHELSGHLRALVTETDRDERVNATVDAWLDNQALDGATYLRWTDRLGIATEVVDRLGASHAHSAPGAVMTFQEILFHNGRFDEAARLGEARFRSGAE